jgi:short-subunit dehydrogenase
MGDEVIITGRKNPNAKGVTFQKFDLDIGQDLPTAVDTFVSALPKIDRFVYAAGFYQEGNLTELDVHGIQNMIDVTINAPIWFCRELLKRNGEILELIAISSTVATTPREREIVYSAGKAGLSQFINSLSLDPRVKKVLIAAPGGMRTKFWQATKHDTSTFNDPRWVAHQIVDAIKIDFNFAHVKILRDPARTELVETR